MGRRRIRERKDINNYDHQPCMHLHHALHMYIIDTVYTQLTLFTYMAAGITYLGAQRWNAVELYPQFPNTLPFTFHTV